MKKFNELKIGDNLSYVYYDDESEEIYCDTMLVANVEVYDGSMFIRTVVIETESPDINIGLEEMHCICQEAVNESEYNNLLLSTNNKDIDFKRLKVKSREIKLQNYRYRLIYNRMKGNV